MKHLIKIALISLLLSGVAFGEENSVNGPFSGKSTLYDGDDRQFRFFTGGAAKIFLIVEGHESCYNASRCKITIIYSDGSRKVVVWDSKDKPIKIVMEPFTD